MINLELLPQFIQEPYRQVIRPDLGEEERIAQIASLYNQILTWLGKLAFLAYRQSGWNSPTLNRKLLGYVNPTPRQWLEWLRLLLLEVPTPWLASLNDFKERYPSLKKKQIDDRLSHLLNFSELAQYAPYAIGTFDISDAKDHVLILVEECFGHANFQIFNNQEPCWIEQGKAVQLVPWFIWKQNTLAWDTEDVSLIRGFQHWLPQEWSQYQSEQNGESNQEAILSLHHNHYVIPPWLELELTQSIQDGLMAVQELHLPNIVMIEGYPKTGKTALATHLKEILMPHIADIVLTYFISASNELQKQTPVIQHWLEKKLPEEFSQISSQQTQAKIVVALDGIEELSDEDWEKLKSWMQQVPMCHWLFVLFKRRYERYQTAYYKNIILQPDDNIHFLSSFSREYLIGLAKQYLNSSLSWRIFTTLMKSNHAWSVLDLAHEFQIFTPRILKKIQLMLPLLELHSSSSHILEYSLYHPAIYGIPAPHER